MGLEAGTYVSDLNSSNPQSTDQRKQGDDHIRLIKALLKATFPNADKPFYFPKYEAATSGSTIDAADNQRVFGCATSGGAFTMTLPVNLGSSADGFQVSFVKTDTNANRLTVAPSSGSINGLASLSILNAGDRIDAVWTGTTWAAAVSLAGVNKVSITGNTTVDLTHFDKMLDVVPASANLTLALPAVASFIGRTLAVKLNSSTYTCTLTPNGSETIDGLSSWVLEDKYDYVKLLAVTGGWQVLEVRGSLADGVPPGAGFDWWGTTAPSGYLLCYGQAISRTTYAKLFKRLGTTFGTGDGSTTFNLPDKRGRVSVGKDDMGGSSADRLTGLSGGLNGDTLGAAGGVETHTLATGEIPSHRHFVANTGTGIGTQVDAATAVNQSASLGGNSSYELGGSATAATVGLSSLTGGGGAHNNVQPSIVANYIIKY